MNFTINSTRRTYRFLHSATSRELDLENSQKYLRLGLINEALPHLEKVVTAYRNNEQSYNVIYLLATELFKTNNRNNIEAKQALENFLVYVEKRKDPKYIIADFIFKHINGETYANQSFYIRSIYDLLKKLSNQNQAKEIDILNQILEEITGKITYH